MTRRVPVMLQGGNAEPMRDYSVAFFDRHLKKQDAGLLRTKQARLHSYEFDAGE